MDPSIVPRTVPGVRAEELDEELLLYSEKDTRVLALNAEASVIWRLCDGERTLGEIRQLIAVAHPHAADQIGDDLSAAVTELVEGGVLAVGDAS